MENAKDNLKILIVDDDPFILDMYVLKFKETHFILEVAHDGKEGLKKCKEFQPDVLLLDVVMPGLDGFDVLRELKKNKITVPKIILLSNLGQKEDIERGQHLGADDYIVKAHFTPQEVVDKVKNIIKK